MLEVQSVELLDLLIDSENLFEAWYGPEILDFFIFLTVEDYVLPMVFNIV